MIQPPDFSVLARRPSERRAIVEYVRDSPEFQETDYLEWKSAYDLSKRPGAALTAKHLIAFANRDAQQAARHAAGHAYLLLGVSSGEVVGVPEWDSADIENWLVRFVGGDLRYDPHYVRLDDKSVLFLTVDPPQPGDPIFCLRAASSDPDASPGSSLDSGTVFVRHGSTSRTADAADLDRLTERARGSRTALGLALDLDASKLSAVDGWWLEGVRAEEYANREGTRLISTLPRPRTAADGPFYSPGLEHIGERRSKDEFRLEVTAYTERILDRWPSIVAGHHMEENDPHIVPVLGNDTENNYEDVVVEITFPPGAHRVFPSASAAVRALELPESPHEWGHLDLAHPSLWVGTQTIGCPRTGARDPEAGRRVGPGHVPTAASSPTHPAPTSTSLVNPDARSGRTERRVELARYVQQHHRTPRQEGTVRLQVHAENDRAAQEA